MSGETEARAQDRSWAARRLFDQAQNETVELVILTAMELCTLGAPKQVLFDEAVTLAWLDMAKRRRRKIMELTTEGLVNRGLLTAVEATRRSGTTELDSYTMDPALGIAVAARSRPAFVVTTEVSGTPVRAPRMYGVGDEEVQVRGIVVELPIQRPPGDFPFLEKMGVLGRFYRYVLVSGVAAADQLAEWADKPAPEATRAKDGRLPSRLVSVYRHEEGRDFLGFTTAFRHDGERAQLLMDGAEDGDVAGTYDRDGLRKIMSDLLVLGR